MSPEAGRARTLRVAIVLAALFNVLALVVLVRATPIAFTVYMFVGQALVAGAFLLLLGAVVADLKAKQIF
ncbi:MAG: hypothetical protein ABW020_01320 [Candidatus Rokuibacteriota bacterium]